MKLGTTKYFIVLTVFLLLSSHVNGKDEGTVSLNQIMESMFRTIENTHRIGYTLTNTERIDGKLLTGTQKVLWQRSPLMCYLEFEHPNQGSKIIFAEGQNDNLARYIPNGFPYIDLNLDPLGAIMRNNNHHTIYDLGFDYFGNLIKHYYGLHPDRFISKGIIHWEGRRCFWVRLELPTFNYIQYSTLTGDSSYTVARRLFVSEHLILERNKEITPQTNLSSKTIWVPSHYANRIDVFIDCETLLPVHQEIFDDKGLFEKYSFYNLTFHSIIPNNFFKL